MYKLDKTPNLKKNLFSKLKSKYFIKQGTKYAKNYDIKNTIFLSCVPRGGSTWLYESLLYLLEDSLGIWEPFCFTGNSNKKLATLKFCSRQFIHPEENNVDIHQFMDEIMSGQVPNISYIPKTYSFLTKDEVSDNKILSFFKLMNKKMSYFRLIKKKTKYKKNLVIKPVRSNRLLRYLIANFNINLFILLVRHPCAVVASQLFHGRWDDSKQKENIKFPTINKTIYGKNDWLKEILKEVNTPEEHLAFTWCLDMLHPLSAKKPYPWHTVFYEDLVMNGLLEIKKILNKIDLNISEEKIVKTLEIPSSTTKNDSNVIQGGNKLKTWQKRLSENEIKNVLKIVNLFGFDFYNETLKPDKEKFNNWKPKYKLVY